MLALVVGAGMLGMGEWHETAFAAELQVRSDDTTVSILDGDKPVLRYRFADVVSKPYADQLFSPGGVQVLRDTPKDHPWHHGLMLAVIVDKVNFWEENTPECGKQRHKELAVTKAAAKDGVALDQIGDVVHWTRLDSDEPLMIERRTIAVLKAAGLDATLISWHSRLEVPPGTESITITGNHYHGLGMRFIESMDTGNRFFNADDAAGEVVRREERLTPTKWCAITGNADGKPVTVAIFDHPQNVRYPARMFTMPRAFAYLSATRNEWKEPLVVKADKPLELTYGVALWDGEVDKATVERLYQRWLGASSNR